MNQTHHDHAGAADHDGLHGLTPLLTTAALNHDRAPANFRNDPPNRERNEHQTACFGSML
jgi:hypothetical protein